MNRTPKNTAIQETTQSPVYYAPAASTKGDKVAIYRYGFELECSHLAQQILSERNPLRKAILRHQMVNFIYEHLEDYSGDRCELLKGAATLAYNAFYAIEETIIIADARVQYNQKCIREVEQEYKIRAQWLTAKREHPAGVVYSTITNNISAKEKEGLHKLSLLLNKAREFKRQLDGYYKICPPNIAQDIIRMAKKFEGMGY